MDYLRTYESIDSTNQEAGRLLAAGEAFDGLTLLAWSQTLGKGQYGRQWMAEPGKHLAMTVILLPDAIHANTLPQVSMRISLGIIRALHELIPGITAKIKWPNDIYVHNQKLAGILIENALQGNRIQHCIAGIGINVNETLFSLEARNAISLHHLTGKTYDLVQVCQVLRQHIIEMFYRVDIDWKEEYDNFIFRKGEKCYFNIGSEIVIATIDGVDMEGKLLLKDAQEITTSYFTHELKWII